MRHLPRARTVARELALACSVAGVTQRELAGRLAVSQTTISRLLNGSATLHVDVADAIARACGYRLLIRLLPGDGIRLRDSGQLAIAQAIERSAQHRWLVRLEVPVAAPPAVVDEEVMYGYVPWSMSSIVACAPSKRTE